MSKYYTGIGSRETPSDICSLMTKISRRLEKKGYILRSGGAKGADLAFQEGVQKIQNTIIYYAYTSIPDWAFEKVNEYTDKNRNFDTFAPYARKLLARNMMQVLGEDGTTPSKFLICWTPQGKEVGGTRYAMRCAKAHGVPIFNLGIPEDRERLERFVK